MNVIIPIEAITKMKVDNSLSNNIDITTRGSLVVTMIQDEATEGDVNYSIHSVGDVLIGGSLDVDNTIINGVQTVTIADDAGGTHASGTITPTSNFVLCD